MVDELAVGIMVGAAPGLRSPEFMTECGLEDSPALMEAIKAEAGMASPDPAPPPPGTAALPGEEGGSGRFHPFFHAFGGSTSPPHLSLPPPPPAVRKSQNPATPAAMGRTPPRPSWPPSCPVLANTSSAELRISGSSMIWLNSARAFLKPPPFSLPPPPQAACNRRTQRPRQLPWAGWGQRWCWGECWWRPPGRGPGPCP